MNFACNYKTAYDTEWEAQRKASMCEKRWGVPIMWYQCGRHWHIANVNRELRNKHVKERRDYCDVCKVAMRPERWEKHRTLQGHIIKSQAAYLGTATVAREDVDVSDKHQDGYEYASEEGQNAFRQRDAQQSGSQSTQDNSDD